MKRRLTFSTSTELVRITPEGLVYISADGNYCTILMADGEARLQTMQLGQVENLIDEQLGDAGNMFIRIGKSLIINIDYLYSINVTQQTLILSDNKSFKFTVKASKDSLKQLKDAIERAK